MECSFTHRENIQRVFHPLLNDAYAALSTEYNQVFSDMWQIA